MMVPDMFCMFCNKKHAASSMHMVHGNEGINFGTTREIAQARWGRFHERIRAFNISDVEWAYSENSGTWKPVCPDCTHFGRKVGKFGMGRSTPGVNEE